ncbi:hypothetical protein MMC07_000655 [Pseudocyphellaria aurata]|nr:hypothetical protein [Pseudocyphellaria aurata]
MVRGLSNLLPLRFAEPIRCVLEIPVTLPFRRALSTTPSVSSLKKVNKSRFKDAFAYHQAKQRKEANVSRQFVLKQQRAKANGDPIRGIPTPFVESFDTAIHHSSLESHPDFVKGDIKFQARDGLEHSVESPPLLNNFITKTELKGSLDYSYQLTKPTFSGSTTDRDLDEEAYQLRDHMERHQDAEKALNAILKVENASSKDRTRINIRRIIDRFGRHNTDQYLKPKAPSAIAMNTSLSQPKPTPRAGPDVGSSEVQIGILTAKIRVLADRYENEGRMDKANKRNLRLLIHRRQKLLKYMLRKERGSERWYHMTQTLGITEATWKGQLEVR